MTPEQQVEWDTWVATRPPVIQALCKKLPPDTLYRHKSTGQIVSIYSYSENNTVTILVSGAHNLVAFERTVFGVDPDSLEPCEAQGPEKRVGVVCKTEAEKLAFIEKYRGQILVGRGVAQIEEEDLK